MDVFCSIVMAFSSADFDSVASVLGRVTNLLNTNSSPNLLGIAAPVLTAWVYGGMDSWLALVYKRYVRTPSFQHN